jgi:ADP-ribose pyrophosphatase YjhB (NUDIX family)
MGAERLRLSAPPAGASLPAAKEVRVMSAGWRPAQRIRPIAIGVIRRGVELLVAAVTDDAGGIKGWRPPGGGIEPGERAADALRREIVEELSLAIGEPRLLAVIESIFEHHGALGHEIVFAFEMTFAAPDAYRREVFDFSDGGFACQARWIEIERFRAGEQRLFPLGLIDKL